MTREEEIKNASVEWTEDTYPIAIGERCAIKAMNVNPAFIAGAKWADDSLLERLQWIDISGNSRLHTIWHGMKQRCYNKKATGYSYYGGKGVQVCEEWNNNYIAFAIWSLLNGYADNLSIDRIDINGNYEPANCRWADAVTQANNTSRNHFIGNETIAYYSKMSGINYRTLHNRVTRGGMTLDDAVNCSMHNPRKVQQLDDSGNVIKEYPSAMAAAIALGGGTSARSHIQDVCRGTRKSALGYKFKYV